MVRATITACGWVLLFGFVGCGGGQTQTETADTAEEWPEGATGAGPNAAPAGPNCDDGTCFVCGEGICPQGAYCDEGAPGGPACAWLTECAGDPSCDCVEGVLGSGCSCRSEGGPIVQCDE